MTLLQIEYCFEESFSVMNMDRNRLVQLNYSVSVKTRTVARTELFFCHSYPSRIIIAYKQTVVNESILDQQLDIYNWNQASKLSQEESGDAY